MRKEFLIGGLVLLIIGFIFSGAFGSILLGLGILILLYEIFSRGSSRGSETGYVEYGETPPAVKETVKPPENKADVVEKPSNVKYVEEKPRYRNADRAEQALKAWGSDRRGKYCSHCGSANNPPDASFCADCGKKL